MICVLTGGTGGAKFVDGLRQVIPPEEITLIVNTGDDLLWWGLYVSPDIDSITYVLSGLLSRERGWGVKGDTFLCLQAMGQLGEPTWFHTGDRDLAVHLLRSRLLAEGKTLSEATSTICDKLGVKARILPMSDSRVETRVDTPSGELSFEEYFVQRWYQDPVNSVRFAGASDAEPAPGVIEAIVSADAVLIAPSNPITSIGPILSVPGIREALCSARGKVAAVSPIVGNAPVAGPAGILMTAQGLPCSIAGVAKAYEDFLDLLVCDTRDARAAEALRGNGLRVQCAQTIMRSAEDSAALAQTVLSYTISGLLSEQPSADESVSDKAGGPNRRRPAVILIPVKNLSAAKQRLAAVLDQPRAPNWRRPCCTMLWPHLPRGRARPACALVTSDPFAIELARQYDFEIIPDPANPGETGAIEMATRFCVVRGSDSTLVVPADIPLIQAGELDQILAYAPAEGSVLAPAADGRGTNAAFRRPANLFPLRFGNDSFKPHLAAAQATGKPCIVLQLPGIALDVDNPEDLQRLLAHPGETRTQSLVRELGTRWPLSGHRNEGL